MYHDDRSARYITHVCGLVQAEDVRVVKLRQKVQEFRESALSLFKQSLALLIHIASSFIHIVSVAYVT